MKFKLWREYGALNSKPVFDAFARGVEKLGYKVVNDNSALTIYQQTSIIAEQIN